MKGHTRRRSSRSLKQNVEQTLPHTGRSRSTSANENQPQRRSTKSTPVMEKSSPRKRKRSAPPPVEAPKVLKRTVDGRVIDAYCWVCHKLGSESICSSCPRVYHKDCLKKLKGNSNQSPFCECQLKRVDGKNEDLNLDARELKKLLQYVMQEAIKEDKKSNQKSQRAENSKFCRLFQAWPSENEALCKIMDLNILLDNMNGEEPYLSTGQFFLDVKWIYHNCCILYGPDYEITEAAFKLEKNFKLELSDMEACPECYCNKYSDNFLHADFFTKVCRNPHLIVWAKLRGSPFWPAKCLGIHNGHVDVRFFGTHDKSNIAINKCFKISRENPLNKAIHQSKYKEAVRELSIYVSNYESMIGPFEFSQQKTHLEDGNTSVKKSNKRGRHRMNNAEQVSRTEHFPGSDMTKKFSNPILKTNYFPDDPMETKVKSSFQFLGNFTDNESNQNIADSVGGVDIESNVVCHMTFTADEHNGPANELNNSEECMDNSTSHCSLADASIDPNLSLSSLNETPGLLSTADVLPSSSVIVTTTEAEQNSIDFLNVNALPVITSVSANEIRVNPLPVITSAVSSNEIPSNALSDDLSASSSFPVIASTVSASEEADFNAKNIFGSDENVKVSMNDLHTDSSSSAPSFSRELYTSFMNEANLSYLLENDDELEEEIQVIDEERKKSIAEDHLKNPSLLKAFSEVLLSSKPQMKEHFFTFHSHILRYFLLLWIEINFSRFDNRDVKMFLELCKKSVKKNDILKKALSKSEGARSEAEKARSEAEKARLDAEKARMEAEKARSKVEEELKELKKKVESMRQGQIPNQKSELKDMIILKASQKMQNKNDGNGDHHKTSENHLIQEIDSLSMQLAEARQKINIKEEDISKLREENEKLKSISNDRNGKVDTCDSEVQTEEFHFELPESEIFEPVSTFAVNQNQDSSLSIRSNLENPIVTPPNSREQQSFTHTDVQVEMQRERYIIKSLSSVSASSALNTGVVQQLYEQNVLTSECTAVMAAPAAGVITAAAAPTLMSVPVVVPSNPVLPPPGPIFLDAESSATYLSSMTSLKSKSKFSNATKSAGKRKKKNA